MKRNPNGFGGVTKLHGNRAKPYMAYLNEKVCKGSVLLQSEENSLQANLESLRGIHDVDALARILDFTDGWERLIEFAESEVENASFSFKYKKKAIGYFRTSKEAQMALAKYNENPFNVSVKPTFKEVYELAYEEKQVDSMSESTIFCYNNGFNKCSKIHDVKIKDIRLVHLQNIIDDMPLASESTYKFVVIVMRMVFDYAIKNDWVVKDYADYVSIKNSKDEKKKKPFTKEEIQRIYEDDSSMGRVVLSLIYTGLRASEYVNTKKSDVDGDIVHIRGTKTKSSDRYVAIHPEAEFVLCPFRTYDILRRKFMKYMQDMNMEHTLHDTRHTFATYSVGMNQTIRMYMLGHSNKNITDDVYTHPELLVDKLRENIIMLEIKK